MDSYFRLNKKAFQWDVYSPLDNCTCFGTIAGGGGLLSPSEQTEQVSNIGKKMSLPWGAGHPRRGGGVYSEVQCIIENGHMDIRHWACRPPYGQNDE